MDFSTYPYNPIVEKIVNTLMTKTQNYDPQFLDFRQISFCR